MDDRDTIAAISTPIGKAGIGIVRLSGDSAISIANRIFVSPKGKVPGKTTHVVHYGYIIDSASKKRIDEVLIIIMKAPNTYTREDVVEISCHGGIITLREILDTVLAGGARLAEPGEFTKRAFLNGRIDLAQAEAVIDVINSRTKASLRAAMRQLNGNLSEKIGELMNDIMGMLVQLEAAVDFLEEDVEITPYSDLLQTTTRALQKTLKLINSWESGKILREGVRTTIVGRPNVGKSSLLNALVREDRSIVTSIPGTTRDIIEETISIKGIPLVIHDTAGIRHPENEIEHIGVGLTRKSLSEAELILFVVDSSDCLRKDDIKIVKELKEKVVIAILNKSDLPKVTGEEEIKRHLDCAGFSKISALTGGGINELEKTIAKIVFSETDGNGSEPLVTNVRHKNSLLKVENGLRQAQAAIMAKEPEEIVVVPLKDAIEGLGEIIGKATNEDLLDKIFAQFCIGK
ncbi:MAG TPA: tRNA uridine-5-carboxymethylaminomethyl(34) synthesis GTPase MnmE [Actinobacteria bacterium]|nr:tRNA uridine-5-carboxymethylaminomethyl(34) synthesis GTPase MnmE [Actinomycetota bacterium]